MINKTKVTLLLVSGLIALSSSYVSLLLDPNSNTIGGLFLIGTVLIFCSWFVTLDVNEGNASFIVKFVHNLSFNTFLGINAMIAIAVGIVASMIPNPIAIPLLFLGVPLLLVSIYRYREQLHD